MTELSIISKAQELLPNGVRDFNVIESELIFSDNYNLGVDINIEALNKIYDRQIHMTNSLPKLEELVDAVECYNDELITEMAMINVLESIKDDGMDIDDISEEEFDEFIESSYMSSYEYYSYNGTIEAQSSIIDFIEKTNNSVTVASDSELYPDFTWGVPISQDSSFDVILNGPQQVMFEDLLGDDDRYGRNGNFYYHYAV